MIVCSHLIEGVSLCNGLYKKIFRMNTWSPHHELAGLFGMTGCTTRLVHDVLVDSCLGCNSTQQLTTTTYYRATVVLVQIIWCVKISHTRPHRHQRYLALERNRFTLFHRRGKVLLELLTVNEHFKLILFFSLAK